MDQFRRFNNAYRLLVAALVSVLSTVLFDYLNRTLGGRGAALAALLLLVTVFVTLFNAALEVAIEKSTLLRKLIAGSEFIEGYWHDVSVDAAKLVAHGVLFQVRFENDRFAVSGSTFDPQGNHIATFRSINAAYSDRVLHFRYESHTAYSEQQTETGVVELQFDKPPSSYSGFYFDYSNKIRFRVHGTKVADEAVREYHSFGDIGDKRAFVVHEIRKTQRLLSTPPQGVQATDRPDDQRD
jgi:hypothetical protein